MAVQMAGRDVTRTLLTLLAVLGLMVLRAAHGEASHEQITTIAFSDITRDGAIDTENVTFVAEADWGGTCTLTTGNANEIILRHTAPVVSSTCWAAFRFDLQNAYTLIPFGVRVTRDPVFTTPTDAPFCSVSTTSSGVRSSIVSVLITATAAATHSCGWSVKILVQGPRLYPPLTHRPAPDLAANVRAVPATDRCRIIVDLRNLGEAGWTERQASAMTDPPAPIVRLTKNGTVCSPASVTEISLATAAPGQALDPAGATVNIAWPACELTGTGLFRVTVDPDHRLFDRALGNNQSQVRLSCGGGPVRPTPAPDPRDPEGTGIIPKRPGPEPAPGTHPPR